MNASALYDFVFRGLLTEEALDKAGRRSSVFIDATTDELRGALSFELLDPDQLAAAVKMGIVYSAIASFENSARRFVSKVLADQHGETWWATKVSEKIRTAAEGRQEDEAKTLWHGRRGDSPMNYTELGDLPKIIQQNWDDFEPYVRRVDWATSIYASVERSRNVIMHSGVLDVEDVERLGMNIRDWIKQVGS